MAMHAVGHAGEIGVQRIGHLLHRHGLADPCEARQVGKQQAQFTPFAACVLKAGMHQLIDHRHGQVLCKFAAQRFAALALLPIAAGSAHVQMQGQHGQGGQRCPPHARQVGHATAQDSRTGQRQAPQRRAASSPNAGVQRQRQQHQQGLEPRPCGRRRHHPVPRQRIGQRRGVQAHPCLRALAQHMQRGAQAVHAVNRRVLPHQHNLPAQGTGRQGLRGIQRLDVVHGGHGRFGGVVAQQGAGWWRAHRAACGLRQHTPEGIVRVRQAPHHPICVHRHGHVAVAGASKDGLHALAVLLQLGALHVHVDAGQHHRQAALQRLCQHGIVLRRLWGAEQQVPAHSGHPLPGQGLEHARMQVARQGRRQAQAAEAGLVDGDHHDAHGRVGRRREAGEQVVLQALQRRPQRRHPQQCQQHQAAQHTRHPQAPGKGSCVHANTLLRS